MPLRKVGSRCLWPLVIAVLSACSSNQEGPGGAFALPQMASLLPEDPSVPGWIRSRQPRGFGPGNLWEYIDGAAESYLAAGFEQLVTAEYGHAQQGFQVVIDIYRMSDAAHASGIYRAERNPDGRITPIGNEGCLSGSVLNFWAGPHYVKITAGRESPELQQELLKLAEKISSRLSVGRSDGN